MIPRIALTSGEPAGIGPELCLALAAMQLPCELVCFGDRALLEERAHVLRTAPRLCSYEPAVSPVRTAHTAGALSVAHVPLAAASVPGRPDPANARYVLALLEERFIAEAHQLAGQLLRCQRQTQLRPDPRRLPTG